MDAADGRRLQLHSAGTAQVVRQVAVNGAAKRTSLQVSPRFYDFADPLPTSSPRNAENGPGSAANATNAGDDHERHDPVNVHGQRISLLMANWWTRPVLAA